MQFENKMEQLLSKYKVEDVNITNSKLIFVLESPHTQELKHQVPVAGASGVTMTRNLFKGFSDPLGILIKNATESVEGNQVVRALGIMNICQLPMQQSAYDEEDVRNQEEFFSALEGIRTSNPKARYRKKEWNELQSIILKEFKKRLQPLRTKNLVFVPCGRFAQKFFKLALKDDNVEKWKMIDEIPHPSYNSWNREKYQSVINIVKEHVSEVALNK